MADRRTSTLLGAVCVLLGACGGGGGTTASATPYANSVALGSWVSQSISYTAGSATNPAELTTSIASALLPTGTTPLVAEHADASLPGVLEVCVSGNGQSTNVVSPINLGVIAQSAGVLLDAGWGPAADPAGAWAAIALRHGVLTGWENCGVKPEGAPSPSSLLTAQADGSYAEDVYDGNPGTTFNVISQVGPAAQMAAMLTDNGFATTSDPLRPMQLYWRIFADSTGRQALIEMGLPRTTAPQSLKGFIALYIPS